MINYCYYTRLEKSLLFGEVWRAGKNKKQNNKKDRNWRQRVVRNSFGTFCVPLSWSSARRVIISLLFRRFFWDAKRTSPKRRDYLRSNT